MAKGNPKDPHKGKAKPGYPTGPERINKTSSEYPRGGG